MGVKPGVLHGDKGVAQGRRHGVDGDHVPVFGALVVGDFPALGVGSRQDGRMVQVRPRSSSPVVILVPTAMRMVWSSVHHEVTWVLQEVLMTNWLGYMIPR